ncbi:MAG: rhodanese-related sulfurtransferase, partial [Saprospiraceae bacterium]|nr:rhodanese-related sulfurtransferase [Saprospiraceae bacterium]
MGKRLYNLVDAQVLREEIKKDNTPRTTLSFYKYHQIKDVPAFRDRFYEMLDEIGVLGRIYVASEGVNGQLSVPTENLELLKEVFAETGFLNGVRLNIAVEDDGKSFFKLAVKIRDKILADGLNDNTFDVTKRGHHIDAQTFNDLTDKEDTVIIDMRNHYESEVGHFEGAITPDVETFRESLPIIEDMLKPHRDKDIVMYCTGGIRCEKASAYFKHKGFDKV